LRFAVHGPGIPVASPHSHGVPRRDVLGRVHVSVAGEATGSASEDGLALARLRIHPPARRTALARESGRYPFDPSWGLVFQSVYQQAPPGVQDASIKPGLCLDVPARVLDGALGTADHVLDVEVLDADYVKLACQAGADLLGPVPAPVSLPSPQLRDRSPDLSAAVRATPSQCQLTLEPPESGSLVPGDPAGLHPSRNLPGPAEPHPARFRNAHRPGVPVQTAHAIGFDRNNAKSLIPPGLPPRRPPVRPAEEVSHCLAEVPQRLLLHHLRAVAQPNVLRSGCGELPTMLREAGRTLPARSPVRVLLDCQIPNVSGVRAMPKQDRFLFRSRSQPVSGHANIIANAGRRERRIAQASRPGSPRCAP
jgi:hypothetical protein